MKSVLFDSILTPHATFYLTQNQENEQRKSKKYHRRKDLLETEG